MKNRSKANIAPIFGAGEGARTLYLNLGKVALYQMSYARIPDLKVSIYVSTLVETLYTSLMSVSTEF